MDFLLSWLYLNHTHEPPIVLHGKVDIMKLNPLRCNTCEKIYFKIFSYDHFQIVTELWVNTPMLCSQLKGRYSIMDVCQLYSYMPNAVPGCFSTVFSLLLVSLYCDHFKGCHISKETKTSKWLHIRQLILRLLEMKSCLFPFHALPGCTETY